MSDGAMCPVPQDHPLMIAWTAYKATPEYANTLHWASLETIPQQAGVTADPMANQPVPGEMRKRYAEGSLWAAFLAGFHAGNENAAGLHESVNPASDQERHDGSPGAGAMGAVIEYRDRIRRSVQL